MTGAPITEAEIASILQEKMECKASVNWITKSDHSWYEATLKVSHPRRDVLLELLITVNRREPIKYSVSLILWNNFRIRGMDVNGSHRNTHTDMNEWRHELHKHKWTDMCHASWACTPKDIDPSSIRSAFETFCRECGIVFGGEWVDPPAVQMDLELS